MTTTTRSSAPAASPVANPAARPADPAPIDVELNDDFAAKLQQFAAVRQDRLRYERTEKLLKDELKTALVTHYPAGHKLVLKVKGIVSGSLSWRKGKKVVDLDLLLEGFPEAYTACVKDAEDYAVLEG